MDSTSFDRYKIEHLQLVRAANIGFVNLQAKVIFAVLDI